MFMRAIKIKHTILPTLLKSNFHTKSNQQIHTIVSTNQITNQNFYNNKDSFVGYKYILSEEKIGVLGYGSQGRSQALNLRENGLNVILGLRDGKSWDNALKDNWKPGHNLFNIEEACKKSSIIKLLVPDLVQPIIWKKILPYIKENDTLCFSHGFSLFFNRDTHLFPPLRTDVIILSPNQSGSTLRSTTVNKIDSSFTIHQDYTKNAKKKALSLGFGVGFSRMYQNTLYEQVLNRSISNQDVLLNLYKSNN